MTPGKTTQTIDRRDGNHSNQHLKRFRPHTTDEPERAAVAGPGRRVETLDPTLVTTRAFLCRALDGLAAQFEAVTVIGSHAVHERTKRLPDVESTSTKDGDLALTPELATDEPSIEALMRRQGFRPLMEIAADLPDGHRGKTRWLSRPGLWGTGIDDAGQPIEEVDLLVPEPLAGGKGRSTRSMPAHGKAKIGRVSGIELAILERDLVEFENFEDGTTRPAYVARPSGIICAKAQKICDRLDPDRPERAANVGKDMVDMWRCMAVSDPREVEEQFSRNQTHPTMGAAISEGRAKLVRLLRGSELEGRVTDSLEALGADPSGVPELFAKWRARHTL